MRNILIATLFFLFLLTSVAGLSAKDSVAAGRLVIKLSKGSELEKRWLAGNRSCGFEEFNPIIGKNTSSPYISDQLLKALDKFDSRNSRRRISIEETDGLKRICVLEFSTGIELETAAMKLGKYPGVEYAEPLPVRKIDANLPNDSLVNEQYYLFNIKAFDAWENLSTPDTIIIGIVDTGVDYLHDDLAANIWTNPGESGLDKNNKDKRSNGIDDDGNGFVDDWHGWDFVSSEDPHNGDNNPYPGNFHGTHVAGIADAVTNNVIGIAGVAKNAKILPVKVGPDDPGSNTVQNSYEGILYAATMGAKVINCSWGSTTRSLSEEQVMSKVAEMGAVVVGAAGNDDLNVPYFPAGSPLAISVAAVTGDDQKASYSNYNSTVDVAAPGSSILSTVPGNNYMRLDGTSMATPVVSGVAALVRLAFPEYKPLQVIEHLKATSDNVDSLNLEYVGKLGKGRVNAFKAVTMRNARSVILDSYTIEDQTLDRILDPGEKVTIRPVFHNVLAPVSNARVEITTSSLYDLGFSRKTFALGNLATDSIVALPSELTITVPENIPIDYVADVTFNIYSDSLLVGRETIQLTFRPSYRTMNANKIKVTFNSRGNIGYNDYPANQQGEGFSYNGAKDILFEGALMIATPDKLSDVARSDVQMNQDKDFSSDSIFLILNPGPVAAQEGFANFRDNNEDTQVGVAVHQHVYQYNDSGRQDFIITVYDIINKSGVRLDSLYCGLFFDWDIGASGSNDQADYDDQGGFGLVKNVQDNSLPVVGVMLITPQIYNYFAIDNPGYDDNNGNGSPRIYDGFSRQEKWETMTSRFRRRKSNVTDVSNVISAGPMSINKGDTVSVAFAILAGFEIPQLRLTAEQVRQTAKELNIPVGNFANNPIENSISLVYPNPTDPTMTIKISLSIIKQANITLDIFNEAGDKVATIIKDKPYEPRVYPLIEYNMSNLSQGCYYLRMVSGDNIMSVPFVFVR